MTAEVFDSLTLVMGIDNWIVGCWCSRTFLSIVGGVVAGVLGLTGVAGFLCYFVIMMLASAGIAAKTKFDIHSYFDSWNRVLFDGIAQGFMVSSALPFVSNVHFKARTQVRWGSTNLSKAILD